MGRTGCLVLSGLLLVLALLGAGLFLRVADPFCWRGYIADDGSCAWE